MEFQKFVKENISEKIIDYVKEQILTGGLKPGDRLPAEETLAAQMGVGRGTIREALRVLVYLGLLERRRNATYVSSQDVRNGSAEALTGAFRRYSGYMEIIEVRRVVEPELAALAAARATPEQVREIGEHYQRMAADRGNQDRFIEHDNLFHRMVFAAAGNSLFMQIMKHIQETMKENQAEVIRRSQIVPRSLEFHRRIYEAIRESEPETARQLMLEHIQDIEGEMQSIFRHDTRRRTPPTGA